MTTTNSKVSNREEFNDNFKDKVVSGYIWMISSPEPIIYNNEMIDFNLLAQVDSFNKIQEAYLTDGVYSIHIHTIDGIERFYVYAFDDFNGDEFISVEKEYPSHIKKIQSLHFRQIYQLQENEISDGFNNRKAIVKLFTGINQKK